MQQRHKKTDPSTYNTAINVIGGLKDCSVIFKAIQSYFNTSASVKEFIYYNNEFHLRTERSRTRIEQEVRRTLLHFHSEEHRELIQEIFTDRVPLHDKNLALMWQFALNNRLFREISTRVFVKIYLSGRVNITKNDIIAYLKEFLHKNESAGIYWSESTINTLSTKYLNLMSKLGFLNSGRNKTFKHINPSLEAQVLFLYFATLFLPNVSNILENDFLPLNFIPLTDVQNRLKKLSMKGFFNMSFNGVSLKIELIHSYKGICDVIYN
jgi:hypothetical protein